MPPVEISAKLACEKARMPSYTRCGDAAVDLCSTEQLTLAPFERALIPTGIHMSIPRGYAGLVLPRSGLAIHQGLSLVNSPGLIDSNYRGEIQVIAINLDSRKSIDIEVGDRIAQFMLVKIDEMHFVEQSILDETVRGEQGFGSSGLQ